MIKDLSAPDVIGYIDKAVSDYGPDWIDPNVATANCRNIYDYKGETKHCIVGYIAHATGSFTEDELEDGATLTAADLVGPHVQDQAAYGLMVFAQVMQDNGISWGHVKELTELLYQRYMNCDISVRQMHALAQFIGGSSRGSHASDLPPSEKDRLRFAYAKDKLSGFKVTWWPDDEPSYFADI